MPALTPYLDVPAADALAATLLPSLLSAYTAADAATRAAALLQATSDVDAAVPYQGRRWDVSGNQANEFPRVARSPSGRTVPRFPYPPVGPVGPCYGELVWDLDPTTLQPVVPDRVKLATLHQADHLLRPDAGRLDAQHEGVASQTNGPVAETYRGDSPASRTGLCRRAYQLVHPYRLVSGRLL